VSGFFNASRSARQFNNNMRLKYFLSLFAFLSCFAISAGLTTSQRSFEYSRTQQQIWKFLEKDRQTGLELENDRIQLKIQLEKSGTEMKGEDIAAFNLVRKMYAAECVQLPSDFCKAWKNHVRAWDKMADFLLRANLREYKKSPEDFETTDSEIKEEHRRLNREINQTYEDLISAAKKYGVDFQY